MERSRLADLQWCNGVHARTVDRHLAGVSLHLDRERTLGNVASGELDSDAVLSYHRRTVRVRVREVTVVVERTLALRTHRSHQTSWKNAGMYDYTHTHPFNGHFSGTTRVSRYQKGKTNLDFTEARDSEWQWHQLCTLLQTDNHTNTPPLSFLQAGCPSCRPTNSVKALKDWNLSLARNKI